MKELALLLLFIGSSLAAFSVDVTLEQVGPVVVDSEVVAPYCLSSYPQPTVLVLPTQNYSAVFDIQSAQTFNYSINATVGDDKVVSFTTTNKTSGTINKTGKLTYQVVCNSCGETIVQIIFNFTTSNVTQVLPAFLHVACPSFAPTNNVGFNLTEVDPAEGLVLVEDSTVAYPWCSATQPLGVVMPASQDEVALWASTAVNASYTLKVTVADTKVLGVNTTFPTTGNFTANHAKNVSFMFTCLTCGQTSVEFELDFKAGNITETVTVYAVKSCSQTPPTNYPFSFNLKDAYGNVVVDDNAVQYPYCAGFGNVPVSVPEDGPLVFEYELTSAPADYVLSYTAAPTDVVEIGNFSVPNNGTLEPSHAYNEVTVDTTCLKCGRANVTFTIVLTNATQNDTKPGAGLKLDMPQPLVCNAAAPTNNSQFQLEALLCGGNIPVITNSEVLYPFCSDNQYDSIVIDQPIDAINLRMNNNKKNATYTLSVSSSRSATLSPSFSIPAQGNLTTDWLEFSLGLQCAERGMAMVTLDFQISAPGSTNQKYSVNFWKTCGSTSPNNNNSKKKTLIIVLAVVIPAAVVIAVAIGIVCYVKRGKSDPNERQPLVQK